MRLTRGMEKQGNGAAAVDAPKDHLYWLGGGLIYAFPARHTDRPLRRCSAQILLSLRDEPFRLTVEGRTGYYRAVAIKPRVARTFHARAAVNVQIDPSHPRFPRFRTIDMTGVLPMKREAFRAVDSDLHLAYLGALSLDAASALADNILEVVLAQLPEVRPLDVRVRRVIQLLKIQPRYPLSELAAAVGLSYYRLSHLFVEEMGIPLRSYQLWRKVHAATKLLGEMSVAEAARRVGFSDGSHLSHAFQRLHAWPPSYFYGESAVRIIARPRSHTEPARTA
jgi:AraC-like DNA-binding protein